MAQSKDRYRIVLLGAFRLTGPDGRRVHVRSKKAIALLAMLATADHGERTRAWLQEKLWGSRGLQQAQYSLRRELSSLRAVLNTDDDEVLETDLQSVRLRIDRFTIDIREGDPASHGEFLEGIDLAGEDAFEDWLREMRASLHDQSSPRRPLGAAVDRAATARPVQQQTTPVLALAVMPVAVDVPGDPALSSLAPEIARRLFKFVATRKWLPVLVAPGVADEDSTDREEQGSSRGQRARYVLEGTLSGGPQPRLVLLLKSHPGSQLIWTETLLIGDRLAADELDEALGRLSNAVSGEVFYAESRRIQELPRDRLGPADLTHFARQNLGHVSLESIEEARASLKQALALAPCTSEQTILQCYVEAMAGMGQEEAIPDAGQMRKWPSIAINADPTDWRGPMLASMIELWLGNTRGAIAHAHSAKNLCPYNAVVVGQVGIAYLWNAEPETALPYLDVALSFSLLERRPYLTLCNLALANLLLGRYGQALALTDQASSCIPELGLAYLYQIEVLIALNRTHEAVQVYRECVAPNFDDLAAIVRRQRVVPKFHLPAAAQALATVRDAAAAAPPDANEFSAIPG